MREAQRLDPAEAIDQGPPTGVIRRPALMEV